jgi:hypothetical protein
VRSTRGEPDATVFDLFDGAGRFLGEMRVPVRIGVYAIGGDLLAGAVSGPDEAPMIEMCRIIP